MAKNWYPIIDKEKCIECKACVDKCKNDVYDKESSTPIVINPLNCYHGCHGCGEICPVDAISYFGE